MIDLKKITVRIVDGVPLFMPGFVADNWPVLPIEEFPHFCGAGSGFGEKAVPDSLLGLYTSAACFIHDCCFCLLSPERQNWYIANGILVLNMLMLIIVNGSKWLVIPRSLIALQYFWGVMTQIGWGCFTNREWVEDYDPYQDQELLRKFAKVGVSLKEMGNINE